MLDIFTNEKFYKLGIAATVVLFVATTVLLGPPPSDSRCTLPWC